MHKTTPKYPELQAAPEKLIFIDKRDRISSIILHISFVLFIPER